MDTLNRFMSLLVGVAVLGVGVFAFVEYGDDWSKTSKKWLNSPKAAFERGVEQRWNHGGSAAGDWNADIDLPDLPEPPDLTTPWMESSSHRIVKPRQQGRRSRPGRQGR